MDRLHDPAAKEFQQSVKLEDTAYFLEQQMKLNLACRGTLLPAYYGWGATTAAPAMLLTCSAIWRRWEDGRSKTMQ